MKITILGSGTSHGVPTIDCMLSNRERCKKDVCRQSETDPKHRRTRSSILVEYSNHHILIDVTPDFRTQALREQISKIDAVLITHSHADHIMGIPDIRSYTPPSRPPLPIYGSPETVSNIQKSFSYIFDPATFVGGGIPSLLLNSMVQPFDLFGTKVTPIPVQHGNLAGCVGYRIGNLGYMPDVKVIPESSMKLLTGLDCLILNCLRDERDHSTHLILPQSMEIARRLKPAKCYFIHMCHDIHYEIDGKLLDEGMGFCYDGLQINI